jgi:hypothetical protein
MEAIIQNLTDPSWWFTGVFFGIFGLLLARLSKHIPAFLKNILRGLIYRRQRTIKNTRFNQSLVYYQIARANSYFLIFVIISCLYFAWFTIGPLQNIAKISPILAGILSLPIYIAEVAWLVQDGFAKELAKARGKIA